MPRLSVLLAVAPAAASALRLLEPSAPAEKPDYLDLSEKEWSAQQVQEELAGNFTRSALFQEKLHRWCKWDQDRYLCELRNTVTHVCPTLYQAAPELVNYTVFVQDVLEFLKAPAKEIFNREGLESLSTMKEVLHLSLIQTDKPHHKKKVFAKKVEEEEVPKAAKLEAKPEVKEQSPEAKKVNAVLSAVEDNNKLAVTALANPFPEVTGAPIYEEKVKEHCETKSSKRVESCLKETNQELLCAAVSKVIIQHHDMGTVSLKMQELLKKRPELNFRL